MDSIFKELSILGTEFSRGPTTTLCGEGFAECIDLGERIPEGWHLELFYGIWAHSV